jgi:hypothetical protein
MHIVPLVKGGTSTKSLTRRPIIKFIGGASPKKINSSLLDCNGANHNAGSRVVNESAYAREIIERELLLAHDPYRDATGLRPELTIWTLLAAVRFKLRLTEADVLTAIARLRMRGYLETGNRELTTRLTDAGAMRSVNTTHG